MVPERERDVINPFFFVNAITCLKRVMKTCKRKINSIRTTLSEPGDFIYSNNDCFWFPLFGCKNNF